MRTAPLLLSMITLFAALPAAATAAPTLSCGTTNRTDPALRPDPHGAFGIFDIRASGASCRSAKLVTRAWYARQVKRSDPAAHLTVLGYRCASPPIAQAQELKATCARGTARIRFRWALASG